MKNLKKKTFFVLSTNIYSANRGFINTNSRESLFVYQLMHNWIVLQTILKFTLQLTLKEL